MKKLYVKKVFLTAMIVWIVAFIGSCILPIILVLQRNPTVSEWIGIFILGSIFLLSFLLINLFLSHIIFFSKKRITEFYHFRIKKTDVKKIKYCYLSEWSNPKYDWHTIKLKGKRIYIYECNLNYTKNTLNNYELLSNSKFKIKYQNEVEFSLPYSHKNSHEILKSVDKIFIKEKLLEIENLNIFLEEYKSKMEIVK